MSEDKKTPESAAPSPDNAAVGDGDFTIPDTSDGFVLAERICWHVLEKKGEDLVVLDLRGRSDVCDFFVLATGSSDVQVRAIARNVQDRLVGAGQKVRGVEGISEGSWALLDYFDVVVHVFQPRAREYFQIERLWGDAGRLDIEPRWFADPAVAERHPDLKFSAGTN